MTITPKGENEWAHQVVSCIHSPDLFIQRDNSDSETGKTRSDLQSVLNSLQTQPADRTAGFASSLNMERNVR